MYLRSINPHDETLLGKVKATSKTGVAKAVKRAHAAVSDWQDTPLTERIEYIRALGDVITENKVALAKIVTQEMGMPITQSLADVDFALEYLIWYADHAQQYLAPEVTVKNKTQLHTVVREPYGVVVSIAPWNFPASNLIWHCVQPLLSGNVVLYKPSEEIPLTTQYLQALSAEVSFPKGVVQFIFGGPQVGQYLVESEIDLLMFTGSTEVGKQLQAQVVAKNIPMVAELGGSAPGIVFEDADFEEIIKTIYHSRFDNCGQICDGLKRLIIHRKARGTVVNGLRQMLHDKTIGNPIDPKTDIGPLVSKKQRQILQDQIKDAVDKRAAKMRLADFICPEIGWYIEPLVIANARTSMRVWEEEVFGPILTVRTFDSEDRAIAMANESAYGLGAHVFTQDQDRFDRVARKLTTGMVSHNSVSYVRPENPFGGVKQSGYGRLHGRYGFEEFTYTKVIAKDITAKVEQRRR